MNRKEALNVKDDAIILIAEDDDGHFSLMERNLLRSGISNPIIRFVDGWQTSDFLNQLKNPSFAHSKHPCLLILDLRLPGRDGMQLLKTIKADPQLKIIPVVMLTTADSEEIIDQCLASGCNMFITKPTAYEQFIQSMDRIGRFLSIIEFPAVIP